MTKAEIQILMSLLCSCGWPECPVRHIGNDVSNLSDDSNYPYCTCSDWVNGVRVVLTTSNLDERVAAAYFAISRLNNRGKRGRTSVGLPVRLVEDEVIVDSPIYDEDNCAAGYPLIARISNPNFTSEFWAYMINYCNKTIDPVVTTLADMRKKYGQTSNSNL